MKHQALKVIALLPFVLLPACDVGEGPEHDPQLLRLQLNYGFRNAVNTFDGTLTKDLVMDGSVTVPFWFTTDEQQQIAAHLERSGFFELPDTIHQVPGVSVDPNPGPLKLRVATDRTEKVVVLCYPPELTNGQWTTFEELALAIWTIVQATPTYQQLPPARGSYL